MSSISFSWNNLRNKPRGNMPAAEGSQQENNPSAGDQQPFDQHALELEWLSMCNRMPQHLSGVATRMKNMSPTITKFPAVEVLVDNQLAQEQVESIKGSIINTLKLHLHNKDITLTIRVAEHQELGKILTRSEQFQQMEEENPSVGKLREIFDLVLA